MSLASIQKISEIRPIPNADNIEVAKVLGWEVVVRKGEFKVEDLCIYIEIDSILPKEAWSEFLFKHDEDKEYRLRTIKLKGQISQGLVLPLTIHNGDCYVLTGPDYGEKFYIGQDVTDVLEIKKYEKPTPTINLGGQKIRTRSFPNFVPKTDEIRIQSAPELLNKLNGKPYYITQKLDGTSATFYKYQGKFGVCSRNMDLGDPSTPKGFWQFIKREIRKLVGKTKKSIPSFNVYWKIADKYNIKEWLPEGYAIQGEICGPGIQGNKMGLNENELFIFNVYIIDSRKYIFPPHSGDGNKLLSEFIKLVPIIEIDSDFQYTLEQLTTKSKGTYQNGAPQEGIVVRDIDQTISFKVVNNDFLLKYGE